MPLPLTVSCFSKIQIGFTFLVPAHLGSPGKRAVKRVCVCVIHVLHHKTDLSHASEDGVEATAKVPVGDRGEDTNHRGIVELVDRDHLQVSQEPAGHVVTTAARWRHRSHKQLQQRSRIDTYTHPFNTE